MFKAIALQILAVTLLAIGTLHAQIMTPAPSPAAKVMQTVGLTDVTVEYSRPAMKGRTIFAKDGLVPYGERWRTGANKNTAVTFSKPVTVGNTELKAGTYALYTKPMAGDWEVYFYADANNSGMPREWDDAKVVAKVMAKSMNISETMENFTILFDEITAAGATMYLGWDKTMVAIPFTVGTDKETMASIERVMAGPSANDYFAAASYYADAGKDMKKAYEWIKQANTMNANPAFWMVRRQALIEAELGMKKEAISSAKRSMELAKAAGNMDYVRMNEASLKEWGA